MTFSTGALQRLTGRFAPGHARRSCAYGRVMTHLRDRLRPALVLAATLALAAAPGARAGGDWAWPVRGKVITPYRNGDDPYAGGQHRGIDIAADVGTPVGAASAGSVTFAGDVANSGLTITVRTSDGRFDTSYLHLSSLAVRRGARVGRGDRLGAVGTTGRRSAIAPHLHFSVRDAGSRHAYHDPLEFLPPPPSSPESPRTPVAVPLPAPVPARPAPAPAHGRLPRRAGAPARSPAARRAPAPRHVPHALPAPAPSPLRAAASVPSGLRTALRHRPARPGPAPRHRPASLGAAPHAELAPAAEAPRERAPASSAARPAGGPDAGWALACVGLLLAAALVGGTEDGRAAASRGRARVAAALRPLLGRG